VLERSPVEAAERRCRSGVEADTLTAVVESRRPRRPLAPAAAAPAARRRTARRGFRNILERRECGIALKLSCGRK
jgi:hypothetical protein